MSTTPIKPMPAPTLEERFRRLAAAWQRDTEYLSSMEQAESHPAYQEIAGPGTTAIDAEAIMNDHHEAPNDPLRWSGK